MMRNTVATPSVHDQVMRRLAPIIVLAFAVFALIASYLYQDNIRKHVSQVHVSELSEYTNQIRNQLQRATLAAEQLSRSAAARVFTAEIGRLEGEPSGVLNGQAELSAAMNAALSASDYVYFAVRYVDLNGTVWNEIVIRNGVPIANTYSQMNILANDAPFQEAIKDASSSVSAVTMRQVALGVVEPALRVFAPITSNDTNRDVLGLIELEILAKPMLDVVNLLDEGDGQRWLLVNSRGRYLADNTAPRAYLNSLSPGSSATLDKNEPELASLINTPEGDIRLVTQGVNLVSSRQISVDNAADMPWTLLIIDSSGYSMQGLYLGVALIVIGSLLACAGTLAITYRVLRNRLGSLSTVSSLVMQLAAGNTGAALQTSGDDVNDLVHSLQRVSARLQALTVENEEGTSRQKRNLEIVTSITQETAALDNMDDLVKRAIELICEEYGFYHAQVFLMDDVGTNIVLRYSRGAIGQRLLEQGLSVPLNQPTTLSTAARTGRAIRVNDVQNQINTYERQLPDTRAQLALPLLVGKQVIGVLDIHSISTDSFREDEQRVFQLLANQIAAAIRNAQQLLTSQQRIHQVDALNRQLTRRAWDEVQELANLQSAYRYNLADVEPITDDGDEDKASGLSVPISIRGEVIGTIDAAALPEQPYTQGDQSVLRAVAERVGLVIEGARLFKETQTALAVTSLLYQLSRYLNEANTLEDIIQAIVSAAMIDATGGQVWLFDEYIPGTPPEWLEITADWSAMQRDGQSRANLRLYVPDSLFLTKLEENKVKLVQDVALDQRLDSHLRQMFLAWGTRAVVFIPFSVRGTWRGIITMEFPRPRDFTEREGRIYSALIDQAGVAIDNRLLLQQTESTLEQIERLYAASRIINSAQVLTELIHAAAAAMKDPTLQLELGLLEGQLDATGWPTRIHKIAKWQFGQAQEEAEFEAFVVTPESPMRHREPEVIYDENADMPLTAMFPMFSANQPIAILYLYSPTQQELSSEDYEVYQALTGQMSTMLENRRLLEQTAQALDETRRLYDASRAITSAPDLNAVYSTAAEHLSRNTEQVSRVVVLLGGPDPGVDATYFDYVFVWNRRSTADPLIQTGLRMTSEAAPFARLVAARTDPLYLPDVEADLQNEPRLRQAIQHGGTASVVITPLRSQRNWFGLLICECESISGFDEQYQRFAQAVADQVAIAIENRELFEEARQEAQRALALAEAGQLASRVGGEFEASLNEVFERVAAPARYDRWLVMFSDDTDPNRLQTVIRHMPDMDDQTPMLTLDLATAQHSVADAVRTERTLTVNNPASYPAFLGWGDYALSFIGKHIAMPIYVGEHIRGALAVGRGLDGADLDERDEQLLSTLAAQVGIAAENRKLFQGIEVERQYLRSILESMPTGILVLDAGTFKPLQANAQVEALLGKPMDFSKPFATGDYNLYRTGATIYYPMEELPIFVAASSGQSDFSDDLAVIHEDGTHTDLMLNAAPILDPRGNVVTIVAAFEDISNLRGLENALQDNLRETISLYELTRSLSEASEMDAVLDIVVMQLMMAEATDGYIVLRDEHTGQLNIVRALGEASSFALSEAALLDEQLFIPDTQLYEQTDPELSAQLQAQGIAALASVPMRARDILLGWIVVIYSEPRDFTPENERFLTTLTDGAAVTIDNRNLFQNTEQAYQEAATLYETSRALSNAATAEDVLQAIVQHMNRPYITQAFIATPPPYEQREIPEVMQVVAYWQRENTVGMNLLGVSLSQEQFPAWRMLCNPSMMITNDITADATLTEIEQIGLESMDTRAVIVLPLRAGNQLIGSIWLSSNEPHAHTEQDQRIFQSLAEQASLSMQANRLLTHAERRAYQLSTSAEVSRIASSILDLNALLPQLVNLIRDAFRYDHVQIFLMDATDTNAELRASTGEAGQQLLAIRHKLEKGSASVIGQVTATGKPALALDTADARFVHRPNPFLPLTRSEMALPLIVKGRVAGALDVQSNQPNAFSQEDVNVLQALAGQISIAIDNALLFAQSERRARDMGFLFTVTSAAALPEQNLHESLQNVAELVLGELNALGVGIYMTAHYLDENDQPVEIVRPVALAGSDHPLSEIAEVHIGDPHNILGMVAQSREAVVLDELEHENRYLPIIPSAQSATVVPLISGNQVIGLITIEDAQPHAFNQDMLTLLRTLNTTLSAIVQNATLLDQVRRQNAQLRELDKLKTDFLANMSHELRTPLNSIIGFSRVILKGIDGPLTEMQEQDLSTIYNSGQHLLGLINDILDQAKINSGKMDLQKDYFEIKPVIEGVRSIGIGLVKDKPIDIRMDVASGLPKAFGDEFRTRQVLLNLVSNAAKFTQEGSITLQVYVDADPISHKDMIRVDVNDTGIGISEKDLALLFEAFRQVDSSLTRTVGGTGLGLVISKSLVEMQGGRMMVQSEVNAGSIFSILIPLEPTEPTADFDPIKRQQDNQKKQTGPLSVNGQNGSPKKLTGPLPVMSEKTDGAAKPRDKRVITGTMPMLAVKRQILLIEDQPDMVDQYRRALQREGFDIFSASIPLEAEAMASGLRPTLIIMDVDFSGGAGWDILSRLQQRDDTRDIPVIVCTLNSDQKRAKELGAFTFIQRPFTPDQIVKAVKEAEMDSQIERVLIIDDQPESARLIQKVLDESGRYRIFMAQGGVEGISMVARHRPDLIILDLRMQEMDGFAVLDELQANPETAAIPILIVTAETLNADEQGRLGDMTVLYKTDLSRENYMQLVHNLKTHLSRQNGE